MGGTRSRRAGRPRIDKIGLQSSSETEESGVPALAAKAAAGRPALALAQRDQLPAVVSEKVGRLEEEVARLREIAGRLDCEKNVLAAQLSREERPLLQRRVLFHADQSRRLGAAVREVEAKLTEADRVRDSWYVPELSRLSGIIEEYEKTKREWFEPQLESRAARISHLEEELKQAHAKLDSMEAFASSRSFRTWLKIRKWLRAGA